ncbi:hypothetical protein [Haliangium sp.]|uniref:hypothetical protein n=1 Tax=Haliangium sp. TaxID=2663208 RepID=UPI003D1029BA
MESSHPFNPGKHKYPLILPLGGMILLGLTTTILGFALWPEPKPHPDVSTDGYFYDAGPAPAEAPTEEPTVPAAEQAGAEPAGPATEQDPESEPVDAGVESSPGGSGAPSE